MKEIVELIGARERKKERQKKQTSSNKYLNFIWSKGAYFSLGADQQSVSWFCVTAYHFAPLQTLLFLQNWT
jgi:hypothetical protein